MNVSMPEAMLGDDNVDASITIFYVNEERVTHR